MTKILDVLVQRAHERPLTASDITALFQQHHYPKSRQVLEKLKHDKSKRGHANENISAILETLGISPDELVSEITEAHGELLHAMCIDYERDHNSAETPARYAKMVVHDTLEGRYKPAPEITEFPNVRNADQLIIERGLRVESMCSHHHQNIRGVCTIAVLPHRDGKVMGLSKYSRILRYYSRRPQIQEELTVQVAEHLDSVLQPRGVAVIIDAEHQCMSVRGVREPHATTRTSHLIGEFLDSTDLRGELYASLKA